MSNDADAPDNFDARLSQRAKANLKDNRLKNPLEMNDVNPGHYYGGKLPNTPLVVSMISFLLGGVCLLGFSIFVSGGYPGHWWTTWQLGFFIQSWAFFHWAEFAVTAGWNRARCNVDCEYLLVFYLFIGVERLKRFSWTTACCTTSPMAPLFPNISSPYTSSPNGRSLDMSLPQVSSRLPPSPAPS